MSEYVPPGEQLVPALYVRNLEQSRAFYERLGFELIRRDGIFMELRWDQSLLFLVELPGRSDAPTTVVGNLRIMVPDVDAFWQRVQDWDIEVAQPISIRHYGLKEFTIVGPDGLNVRFATRVADL